MLIQFFFSNDHIFRIITSESCPFSCENGNFSVQQKCVSLQLKYQTLPLAFKEAELLIFSANQAQWVHKVGFYQLILSKSLHVVE